MGALFKMADNMVQYKLQINKDYAKKLHKQKEKAELDSLKQKYGNVDLSSDEESSSSESEDEDARELTVQTEKEFLTVLSLIKKKDPKIYTKDSHFYHSDDEESDESKEKKKKKPMYLKDYERRELLEKGSKAFISDDENNEVLPKETTEKEPVTYFEEQKFLKDSFKDAIRENDEEDEEFLKVRVKSEDEKKEEENAYIEWLKGEKERIDEAETRDMDALKRFWTDPDLDSDEKFLRDFILNKGYIDKEYDRIPTYDEIIAEENDTEDQEEVEKQEEFERKYNFRFEEPDSELIKCYPRTVGGSVRRSDDRRKEKRKAREERKKQEKEKKKEELKRLKNLKKKEIMEKLEKLKEVTGNPNVGFSEEDLEGDFDPSKFDQAMKKVFDEQYYADEQIDEEKPVFEDDDLGDIEEEPNWDEWQGNDNNGEAYNTEENTYEPHCEDPDFNMDADYEENNSSEMSGKKRKRRSKLAQALKKHKPVFDPDEKTFEEYFDEYYKLDYEDLIGDLPCRFKYRSVVPNDFGLTMEEILTCPDRELNQWVSLKRAVQYRSDFEERRDIKKYRKRSRDNQRKMRILASLTAPDSTNDVEENLHSHDGKKNKKGKKDNGDKFNAKRKFTPQKENNCKKTTSTRPARGKWQWKRGRPTRETQEAGAKRKLAMRFRGADKKHITKLSAGRLAAFGLEKKRKKKK